MMTQLSARPAGTTILGTALLVVMVAAAGAAPLSFRGLGDLPGGGFGSRAAAVSADGRVVVGSSVYQEAAVESRIDFDFAAPPQLDQAFRWTETEGMVGLDLLPGTTGSRAAAVSADGSVVIGNTSFTGGDGLETNVTRPFRWTAGVGVTPSGQDRVYAHGVSADGAIVVGTRPILLSLDGFVQNPPGPWAVRWTPDDATSTGPMGTSAHAISADGSVIVGSAGYNSFMPDADAFRWTAAGDITYLEHLPGGVQAWATDVSADGSVIVGHDGDRELSSSGWGEAFRWTEDGGIVGLGDLPGGASWSEARAVSADGSVVVGRASTGYTTLTDGPLQIQTPDPIPVFEAFIWTENAGMRNLGEVLTSICGLDLTGWTLTTATDVSADGLTVVGSGINPDGNAEAWIATIPEPATLALLAGGFAMLVLRRRRT